MKNARWYDNLFNYSFPKAITGRNSSLKYSYEQETWLTESFMEQSYLFLKGTSGFNHRLEGVQPSEAHQNNTSIDTDGNRRCKPVSRFI